MCNKANRTLGFLRRNLYQWRQHINELFARFWNMIVMLEEIEIIQNRAARFAASNYYFETNS